LATCCSTEPRSGLPVTCRIERRAPGARGAPGAPPLEAPRPPVKNGVQGAGAVGPASPSGRNAEVPAAAPVPHLARREFPKSRPPAGAMLISPILFILSECAAVVPLGLSVIDKAKSARSAVHVVFQPQRRRAAWPRPERAAGERSRRRKPALLYSAVGFSGASWETDAVPTAHMGEIANDYCAEPAHGPVSQIYSLTSGRQCARS